MLRSLLAILTVLTSSGFLVSCGTDNSTAPVVTPAVVLDTNTYGFPWKAGVTFGALVDSRDNQVYRTVTIGKQTWMAQNLNFKADSSRCYLDSARNCPIYGRFYQWAAAMNLAATANHSSWNGSLPTQGVCPSGWHLPSSPEWDTLVAHVGGASYGGTKLKSTLGWPTGDNGTDSIGFRVLPAGCLAGSFKWVGQFALYWSATETGSDYAVRNYFGDYPEFLKTNDAKVSSFSVRCVKN